MDKVIVNLVRYNTVLNASNQLSHVQFVSHHIFPTMMELHAFALQDKVQIVKVVAQSVS